jgi:hypothetical protein
VSRSHSKLTEKRHKLVCRSENKTCFINWVKSSVVASSTLRSQKSAFNYVGCSNGARRNGRHQSQKCSLVLDVCGLCDELHDQVKGIGRSRVEFQELFVVFKNQHQHSDSGHDQRGF